ncbi:MAG: hypothetical protein ACLSFO_02830 [Anaerovoracaceae bacterium]
MMDERRCMDCCEQDCRDKCFKECYCNDDNNGSNLIWLIILIVIIYRLSAEIIRTAGSSADFKTENSEIPGRAAVKHSGQTAAKRPIFLAK